MIITRKIAYGYLCKILSPNISSEIFDLDKNSSAWELIYEVADSTFVLSELHQSIVRKGMKDVVPDSMLAALDEISGLISIRKFRLLAQMREVNSALSLAGILPVWLKGAALLSEPEGLSEPRLMSDLDLWIPEKREQALALSILGGLGYSTKPGALLHDWDESHHYAPMFHPKRPVSIELHRHVIRKSLGTLLSDVGAAGRLEHSTMDDLPIARLSYPDRVMHSLVQCSLMSTPPIDTGQIRLMKVMDLVRLLGRSGAYVIPPETVNILNSSAWTQPIGRFLTLLERDFGVPNPLDGDSAYCDAVDHFLVHRRPPASIVFKRLFQAPGSWRKLLSQPSAWPEKIARRVALAMAIKVRG